MAVAVEAGRGFRVDNMPFCRIEEALDDIRAGKMVIVVDDEDRENEGDLTVAAEKVTPEIVNFMARYGRGLICLPMTASRLEQLGIPLMVSDNTSRFGTAFTISIEARHRVTTGISAADRAHTILTAADPRSGPDDIVRPGHVFPLRARPGGVLERAGQTEAAVDLARIAGLSPAGVICEIMNDDGTMARLPHLREFASRFGLKIASIADLIQYRLRTELLVKEAGRMEVETEIGPFTAVLYHSEMEPGGYLAMVAGDVTGDAPVHVRVQHASVLSDVFLAGLRENRGYLMRCMEFIAKRGHGVVVYILSGGAESALDRDFKLPDHWKSVSGGDGVAVFPGEDPLKIGMGVQVLLALGLKRVILLSAHPKRLKALHGYGIEIAGWLDVAGG